MSISTPGVGSGLDIRSIISQLMAIERQPLVALGTEQVGLEAQFSAVGKLKSDVSLLRTAMTELSDAAKFKFAKAVSTDEKILTASADSTAAKGTFKVDVNRIAENHRQAANTVFANTDVLKIGAPGATMKLAVGSDSFIVEVGDKTLAEIRDAINSAADNHGVTASILHDDSGYRLTLSANDTGSDNLVAVTYATLLDPVTPGPDLFALQTLNADRNTSGGFTAADLDAELVMEGAFTVTRTKNAISDIIDGVTFNLVDAGEVTLNVSRDDAKIAGSVNQFIGVYNQVVKTISELRGNVLASERGALNSLSQQFRNILNEKAGNAERYSFASELGLTTGLDGRLTLNTTIFNNALAQDAEGVADMFANDASGLAVRFENLAKSFVDAGGVLNNREVSLRSRIDDIRDERVNLEYRLTLKEQALVSQYSALDSLVATLNTTSSYLTTQFAALSGNSR